MNGNEFRGKKILVVGLARSGLAAANFLLGRGARVTVTDTKTREQLEDALRQLRGPVRLALGGHRAEDFMGADLIVLSPGVPSRLDPIRRAALRGVPVWSEVELAFRCLRGRFVGVTGSNGKTTTTALVGRMFADAGRPHAVAGNIGAALIGFAEDGLGERVFVVELSSFQLENIHQFRCHAAALLNVTPDHLDRYDSFGEYAECKRRIFLNQTAADFAVLNLDDPVASRTAELQGQVVPFSRRRPLEEGVFVVEGKIRARWDGLDQTVIPTNEIRLLGNHNVENALAATALGLVCGLEPESMAGTLRTFAGVEHRLEFVRTVSGVDFYNDSKATNVDSAVKALESFERPLLVILGGLDKEGDFSPLQSLVRDRAKRVIVIGKAAPKIEAALTGWAPIQRARDLEEAVRFGYDEADPGDVVLLAPACASFDAFLNYEHRGRVFKDLVASLGPKNEMAGK